MPMSSQSGASSGFGKSLHAAKESFFDSEAILNVMDRKTHKAISKYLAFVRRKAQTSIRYRKKTAAAGQPPSGHRSMARTKTNKKTGVKKVQQVSPLREFIYFAYDRSTKSGVCGPILAEQRGKAKPTSGTVPSTLEKGGSVRISKAQGGVGLRERRRNAGLPQKVVIQRIAAHPYMGPAEREERPKLLGMFAEQGL